MVWWASFVINWKKKKENLVLFSLFRIEACKVQHRESHPWGSTSEVSWEWSSQLTNVTLVRNSQSRTSRRRVRGHHLLLYVSRSPEFGDKDIVFLTTWLWESWQRVTPRILYAMPSTTLTHRPSIIHHHDKPCSLVIRWGSCNLTRKASDNPFQARVGAWQSACVLAFLQEKIQ